MSSQFSLAPPTPSSWQTLFVSPATRFDDWLSKTTKRPSGVIDGRWLSPSPAVVGFAALMVMTAPPVRSFSTTFEQGVRLPFGHVGPTPLGRFVARVVKTT